MNSFLASFFTTCSPFFWSAHYLIVLVSRLTPWSKQTCTHATWYQQTMITIHLYSLCMSSHHVGLMTVAAHASTRTHICTARSWIVILHSVLSELVPSLSLGMAQRDLSQKRISSARDTCTFFKAKDRNKGIEISEIHNTSAISDANALSEPEGISWVFWSVQYGSFLDSFNQGISKKLLSWKFPEWGGFRVWWHSHAQPKTIWVELDFHQYQAAWGPKSPSGRTTVRSFDMCDCFDPFERFYNTREGPLDCSERKQPSRQPTSTAKLQPTVVWPFGAAAMAKKSKASKGSSGKKSSGDGGRFVVSLLHTEVVGAQRSSGHHMLARFLYVDFMTYTSAHIYIYCIERLTNTSENRRVKATLFPHFCGIIYMTSILTLRVWVVGLFGFGHSFQHLLDRSLRREEAKERQW